MKGLLAVGGVCIAAVAMAMPTRDELKDAQEMVRDVTAPDIRAFKNGSKKAVEVAAVHMDLAAKSSDDAEKYLLLQGAFNFYVKAGDYDAAAGALEKMMTDISDVNYDAIVEIYNKAVFRSMKTKSPRLYAVKETARRISANRKRLSALEKEASANPQDVDAQKKLGECLAEIGDWAKALDAFAKADGELAKMAKAEKECSLKPQEIGDYWWEYSSDQAYRLHAVESYRRALGDSSFAGLARARAENRIKASESDGGDSVMRMALSSKLQFNGGEAYDLVLDSKDKVVLNLTACPAGEFMQSPKSKAIITYPFLIMKGRLTFGLLRAIDKGIEATCRNRVDEKFKKFIADDMAVSPQGDEMDACLRKLNALVAKDSRFRAFRGYELRYPTLAEWRYAYFARGTGDRMKKSHHQKREEYWLGRGFPKLWGRGHLYPLFPDSYAMKNTGCNAWGIYAMTGGQLEPIQDCIKWPRDKNGNRVDGITDEMIEFADVEVNPLRWYSGKDVAEFGVCQYMWAFEKGWKRREKWPNMEYLSTGGRRFVFAPKLSALNVYPRTDKDGPLKDINGKRYTLRK